MKQEIVKALADGSNILTAGAGIGTSAWGFLEYWDFVNTNAAGIGVLLTLFFGLIAMAFNFYNSSKANQSEKNKKELSEQKEKLDSILSKLNKLDKG